MAVCDVVGTWWRREVDVGGDGTAKFGVVTIDGEGVRQQPQGADSEGGGEAVCLQAAVSHGGTGRRGGGKGGGEEGSSLIVNRTHHLDLELESGKRRKSELKQ